MTTASAPRREKIGVSRGVKEEPVRVLIYAPEGVGKTTFAAESERPIILDIERGSGRLDVSRVNEIPTWDALLGLVGWLENVTDYRTIVIDTVDRAEQLCWAFICERDKKSGIEDYGYGKGYQAALDEWRRLLAALERVQAARGMQVVLVAHSQVRTFKNPLGEDYDRYSLKLNDKASGALKEWCDVVLFANLEETVKKQRGGRAKGVDTGARMIYTQRCAAYDAKSRYAMPAEMPLSGREFWAALAAGKTGEPERLRAQIVEVADAIVEVAAKPKIAAALAAAGDDTVQLARVLNRARATLRAEGEV